MKTNASLWAAIATALVLTAACSSGPTPAAETKPVVASSEQPLIDFGELANAFVPVDDRVMGGISQSRMVKTEAGHAVFRGQLSLENNGGFASVRGRELRLDVSGMTTLVLRVRGDGKRYKLRLYDEGRFDGVSFQTAFDTVPGQWVEVELPLDDFRPVWRGRAVLDTDPLDRGRIQMVGLMISDRQQGAFELELDWLAAR